MSDEKERTQPAPSIDDWNRMVYELAKDRDRRLWRLDAIRRVRDALMAGRDGAAELALLWERDFILAGTP